MDSADPRVCWVVYDHPADFPDVFVARRWAIVSHEVVPTSETRMSRDIEELRLMLSRLGLYPVGRFPTDDPKILETWI